MSAPPEPRCRTWLAGRTRPRIDAAHYRVPADSWQAFEDPSLGRLCGRAHSAQSQGDRIHRRAHQPRRDEEPGCAQAELHLHAGQLLVASTVRSAASGAEYINHCCEPNIVAAHREGAYHLLQQAPDSSKGEELTVDYQFEKHVEKVLCACGSAGCRGTINVLR